MKKCTRPWWKFWQIDPHLWTEVWDGPGKTIPGAGGWRYGRCVRCGKESAPTYFNS